MHSLNIIAMLALLASHTWAAPIALPVGTEAVDAHGFLGEEAIWNSGKYADKRAETESVDAHGFLGEEAIWNSGKYADKRAETESVDAHGFLGEEAIWNSGKYADKKRAAI